MKACCRLRCLGRTKSPRRPYVWERRKYWAHDFIPKTVPTKAASAVSTNGSMILRIRPEKVDAQSYGEQVLIAKRPFMLKNTKGPRGFAQ